MLQFDATMSLALQNAYSVFHVRTLPHNLCPHAHSIPGEHLRVLSKTNSIQRQHRTSNQADLNCMKPNCYPT